MLGVSREGRQQSAAFPEPDWGVRMQSPQSTAGWHGGTSPHIAAAGAAHSTAVNTNAWQMSHISTFSRRDLVEMD